MSQQAPGVFVINNYQWRRVETNDPPGGYQDSVKPPIYEFYVTQKPLARGIDRRQNDLWPRMQQLHNRAEGPYVIIGVVNDAIQTYWYFNTRGKDRNQLFLDLVPAKSRYDQNVSNIELRDMFAQLLRPQIGCSHFRVHGVKFINYRNSRNMSTAWEDAGFAHQFVNGTNYWGYDTNEGYSSVVCYAHQKDIPPGILRQEEKQERDFFYWKGHLQRLLDLYEYRDGERALPAFVVLQPAERLDLWQAYRGYFQEMLVEYANLQPNERVTGVFLDFDDRPFPAVRRQEWIDTIDDASYGLMDFFSRMPSKYPVLFAWCTLQRLYHMILL